jgi:hypothetical protein
MIAEKIFKIKPTIRAQDHVNDYIYYKSLGQAMRKILKKKVIVHNYELPPINIICENKIDNDF